MKTKFQKWGNSLALRVPSAFADEVGATEGKRAVMTIENGALVVKVVERAKNRRRYSLEQLLAGLSREERAGSSAETNREVDWGQPRGREVW